MIISPEEHTARVTSRESAQYTAAAESWAGQLQVSKTESVIVDVWLRNEITAAHANLVAADYRKAGWSVSAGEKHLVPNYGPREPGGAYIRFTCAPKF